MKDRALLILRQMAGVIPIDIAGQHLISLQIQPFSFPKEKKRTGSKYLSEKCRGKKRRTKREPPELAEKRQHAHIRLSPDPGGG